MSPIRELNMLDIARLYGGKRSTTRRSHDQIGRNHRKTEGYWMVFERENVPPRAMFLDEDEAYDYRDRYCIDGTVERYELVVKT